MSVFDTLPVLLVSTATEAIANSVILDLINNDVTEEYSEENTCTDRVWRLDNKYYTADVRVHALTDVGNLDLNPNTVEAHIIHITEDEVSGGAGAAVERAAARAGAGGVWARCAVRVALAPSAHAALDAWAAAQRADLVPLCDPPEGEGEGEGEPFAARGLERARAALHAHVWPNLRRKGAAGLFTLPSHNGTGGDSESDCEGEGGDSSDDVRAVERAEEFARALGALHAAPPAPPAAPRAERLQRAEELLAAFCRALGLDTDAL